MNGFSASVKVFGDITGWQIQYQGQTVPCRLVPYNVSDIALSLFFLADFLRRLVAARNRRLGWPAGIIESRIIRPDQS